jgi:hypothetical protein
MSCEQAIYKGYLPAYAPFDVSTQDSLAQCSQKCCDTNIEGESCGIYSYWESLGRCNLYQLPDQPFYLPLPSVRDMVNTKNPDINTGILMKRKIFTWIPWLIMFILAALFLVGLPKGLSF